MEDDTNWPWIYGTGMFKELPKKRYDEDYTAVTNKTFL
jgi:hypothetical protein